MVSKTNNTSRHFYEQTVNLEKGKTYTFSGYIKTGTTAISNTHGKGAALFVNYQDSNGTWQTVESNYVNGIKNWDRYVVTFTVPSDAKSTMVYLRAGVIEETGTAYFDCFQLEDGKIANRYNLVENADFSNGMTGWTKNTYTDSNDLLRTVGGAPGIDANAFELTGDAAKSKNFYQIINVSGNANDIFSIGGWARGQSVSTSNGSGRYYALDIAIRNKDTGAYQYKVVHFNEDATDWQYATDMIKANFAYDRIIVYGLYYNNANYAFFDGIQLYKEEYSESYTVNTTTGNLESTKNVAERNSTFNYNAKNELTSYVDPKGSTFTYDYKNASNAETHNLYKATTPENVVYSFDYDSHGNPIKASVGTASSVVFTATATYTTKVAATETEPEIDEGNYIKSVIDNDGNETKYDYNQMKGTLDSVTNAKGNTTSYSYDNLDRLTSASSQGVTNNYTYENDRLKKITHNGFSYVFDYDSYGRVSTVGIDGQTSKLITNTYDATTGNLTKSTYGNNDAVGMEYDNLDRVKVQKYGKDTELKDRYRFEYDASGNLGYEEDLENGVNYRYTYDLADRLAKVTDSNNNTLTYSFDKNSNVSNSSETVNGQNHSTGYTYDKDNKITKIVLDGQTETNHIDYSYDVIGRLVSETVTIGSITFKTTYTYTDANGVNKAKLQKLSLPNGREISYTYDKNNNIESIQEGSKIAKYTYDGLNQLIREDNGFLGTAGKTITYSYDAGGNILSKNEYPLTTGDNLPAAVKTYEYKYDKIADGGTGWNDKLVKIIVTENGTPTTYDISYDNIGNPTSYNGYSYTWEGRQLRIITGNGKNISFKYDSSGIRTEKTVDGNVTKYHLVGDEVTYEETKDSSGTIINKIYYIYSSSGKLVAMNFNGVQYNYIRNNQGDIIGLLDLTGAEAVSYSYDSWGKLESIGGTKASTVGVANPYRYRGYRYDIETGLYYLQNRYYNPEWGRFINTDALAGQVGELLSHNIFAYCKNDPINMSDDTGFRPAFDSVKKENAYYDWKESKKKPIRRSNKHRATMRITPSRGTRLEDPNTDGSGYMGNNVGGGSSGVPSFEGAGEADDFAETPFVPDEYWKRNAPDFNTPSSKITHYKDNKGVIEKSTVIYDDFGRQKWRIDYNNHGYSDHSIPHLHERIFGPGFDPGFGKEIRYDWWRWRV